MNMSVEEYLIVICVLVAVLIYNKMKILILPNMKPNKTMTITGMTKKTVKKKTVKNLETSDSLNPVIGKMEQEVLKKKQKFKVEEKNE
jgi:hypothetical protein